MNHNRVETLVHTLNVLHSVAHDIVVGNSMDNLDLADIKTAIQMLTGSPWNGEREWQWNDKITIPVPNESLDSKLIDRVMWHMARDMEFGDSSATWELLHILAISSPANRKTILQYLPEEEWDNFVPQQ